MSHVTQMNESCCTHGRVMSQIRGDMPHTRESCHFFFFWTSHKTYLGAHARLSFSFCIFEMKRYNCSVPLSCSLFLRLSPFLSLSLSTLYLHSLSMCLSICLSVCLSVYLSVCLTLVISRPLILLLSRSLALSLSHLRKRKAEAWV